MPPSKDKVETQRDIQRDLAVETHYQEREGQGKENSEERNSRRSLSDEEWEKALNLVKEFSGIKSGHLSLHVEKKNHQRVIRIEDSSGQLVKRIFESDLWYLLDSREKPTGQILDKTA